MLWRGLATFYATWVTWQAEHKETCLSEQSRMPSPIAKNRQVIQWEHLEERLSGNRTREGALEVMGDAQDGQDLSSGWCKQKCYKTFCIW